MARQNAQKSQPNPAPKAAPERTEDKKPAATASAPTSKTAAPTQEQIARRAYEIFQARGGTHGNPEHDWHQAERELRLGRQ
ncbi:hypothetical protein KH5H1_37930 [Corallococcus caeni]|uniref:DUF2934 domain-containing protein n=2 Tax=Corallococcus TaxID=83461 RepID=A0A7Y4JZS6_9BACT|nr:DUF2934 domain-containing protein [Corallococcus exercitus]NOK13292.1 DUF2934 domain-containing protein [Corallococcus exercitus]GMT99673.1 hypothetical protein KH5H1_37930 [Corallococcus sp. KH5-1]GMU08832.1 hypothetical protein ASNO1_50850 [Corallococcus sp. NO1]